MFKSAKGIPPELLALCQKQQPEIFLVLGSGYGEIAEKFNDRHSWNFSLFPEITPSTIPGHKGCLSYARHKKVSLLISEGRIHHYEGHPRKTITTTTRIAHSLGCRVGLFTNAAGGISPEFNPGSIMLIKNHIDTVSNSWNNDKNNPGFTAENPSPYDSQLLKSLEIIAKSKNLCFGSGTYMMVSGPSYESNSEIKSFAKWKADAVGMSTAWEVDEGFQLGMKCAGISGITNKAAGLSKTPPSHAEVLENAKKLSASFEKLLFSYLENL